MKQFWLLACMVVLSHSFMYASENNISEESSVGARTEALFIVNNKLKDIREYIQLLKKQLTDSFAEKRKPKRYKNSRLRALAHHQEALRHSVLPVSIQELEALIVPLEKSRELLEKDSVDKKAMEKVVQHASLAKKKIDLESHILELIATIDMQEIEQGSQVSNRRVNRKAAAQPSHESIANAKKQLTRAQKALAETDALVYQTGSGQEVRANIERLQLFAVPKKQRLARVPKSSLSSQ